MPAIKQILLITYVLLFSIATIALARGGYHRTSHSSRSYSHSSASHSNKSYSSTIKHHRSTYSHATTRDKHGRIKRSTAAKKNFMHSSGYPDGRPGYVVDHVIPLKRGGSDSPSNMQWQTIQEAKTKDKIE